MQTETFPLVATTLHGLEATLVEELQTLGAKNIVPLTRAVSFEGDNYIMYKANYRLRTALRILKPIASFTAKDENQFYEGIKAINWLELMTVDDTFAINAATHSEIFTHSQYIALKAKDAIADLFRDVVRKRPNVKLLQPSLRIHIHITGDKVDVSLDSSCESLHKRGYRTESLKAPINEVLAAGMIKLSGWQADSVFIDPMCGSGTILVEAAMLAYNIAPQHKRDYFGFKNWKDFNETTWMDVKQEALAEEKTEFKHDILGFDVAFQAVRMTQRNLERAGLKDKIKVRRKDFEKNIPPTVDKGIVIINPPYGERIETDYETNAFYAMMGDHMKEAFTNYDVWLISSNMEALKCVGLRPSHKNTLYNGALECKYQCYKMYKGTLKKAKQANAE